jgi:hypothetical protein
MQNTIFFYAFLCIFIQNPKLKFILYIIPLSILEVQTSFFSVFVHPILTSIHFYSLFTSNPQNISPEFTRLIFFILVIFIYIIKIYKKVTFNNIFIMLSMLGIFFTAILFHTITIKQLNYYTNNQSQTWSTLINTNNIHDLNKQCELLNVECKVYPVNEDPFLFSQKEFIQNYKPFIEPYFNKEPLYFFYTISSDPKISDRILSRKPIAFLKNTYFRLIIIDHKNYTNYIAFNQLMFDLLAFTSHVVWLFGALFLIYFHDKKIQTKRLQQALKHT